MSLPVIAITNASTCLTDAQVQSVIPSLQRQVTRDFNAYWNIDCSLTFLPRKEPLTAGWWQIVVTDSPDQAGALGYHELASTGAPLGKVFAALDIDSGSFCTDSPNHDLLEIVGASWRK